MITAKKEAAGGHDPSAAPLKLEEFLPYRLNVVASLVSQALSRIYVDRYGIDVPEWRILVTLGQYETHDREGDRRPQPYAQDQGVARGGRARAAQARWCGARTAPTGARRSCRSPRRGARSMTSSRRARLISPGVCSKPVDPADRAAFERAVTRLTEQSAASCSRHRSPACISGRRATWRPQDAFGRRGGNRATLFVFPFLRRLSRADRAQSQGPAVRDRVDPPHPGRRPPAFARVSRRQSAGAGAGAGGAGRRCCCSRSPSSSISTRSTPHPPLLPEDAIERAKVRGGRADHRLRHPPAQQHRARSTTCATRSRPTRPPSRPGMRIGCRPALPRSKR